MKTLPDFFGPEVSLSFSQEPRAGPYPEQDESILKKHGSRIAFLERLQFVRADAIIKYSYVE
jgi:hypothetical protein